MKELDLDGRQKFISFLVRLQSSLFLISDLWAAFPPSPGSADLASLDLVHKLESVKKMPEPKKIQSQNIVNHCHWRRKKLYFPFVNYDWSFLLPACHIKLWDHALELGILACPAAIVSMVVVKAILWTLIHLTDLASGVTVSW